MAFSIEEAAAERKRRLMEGADPNATSFRPAAARTGGGGGGGAMDTSRAALIAASAAANPTSVPSTAPAYEPQFRRETVARPMQVRDINPKTGAPYAGLGYRPGADRGQVMETHDVIANPLPGQTGATGQRPIMHTPGMGTTSPVASAAVPDSIKGGGRKAIEASGGDFYKTANGAGTAAPAPQVATAAPTTFRTSSGRIAPTVPGVTTTKDANGRNVYTATGASVAAAEKAQGTTGVSAQSFGGNQSQDQGDYAFAQAPRFQRAAYDAPSTNLSGNTGAADRERQQRIHEIDTMIGNLGPLNMDSRRDAAVQLAALKTGLTKDAFSEANDRDKVGGTLNERGSEAALGANSTADQGAEARSYDFAKEAMARRARAQEIANTLTGADGTTSVLRQDGSLTPLTGAGGEPFREAGSRFGPKEQAQVLTAQLGAYNDENDPEGKQRARVSQQLQEMVTGNGASSAAPAPPAGYKQVGTSNGQPVYEDEKGNRYTF